MSNFQTYSKEIQLINNQLLIYGYIKQYILIKLIPTDIIGHIQLWFGSRKDKWDKINTSTNIIYDNNDDSMIKRIVKWDGYHYNAFGYNLIGKGQIKKWKLKIIKTKPRFTSCIQLGIIEFKRITN